MKTEAPPAVARQVSLRLAGGILLALGAATLLAAYLAICVDKGTAWPWDVVVHEDGERTLIDTVLYYEHATRELPLDILLGLAIGGSALLALPPPPSSDRRRRLLGLAAAASLVSVWILVGTLVTGGAGALYDNLLQFHSRPGATLEWGAHWRYHLGERLAEILVSIGIGGALLLLSGKGRRPDWATFKTAGLSVALFLILSAVFAKSGSSLGAVFGDPVTLGHQARELLTHFLVTIPLAWGAVLLYRDREGPGALIAADFGHGASQRGPQIVAALAAGVVGAALALYLCVAAAAQDSASHGQSESLAVLLFPHFFEHAFTYVITPIVAVMAYAGGSALGNPLPHRP